MMLNELLETPKTIIEREDTIHDEQKLCDIIKTEISNDAKIALIGIPFDLGVKFSKGRSGAKRAPDNIRKQISKYGTTFNIDYLTDISDLKVYDFGNIIIENRKPAETYERISEVIYELAKKEIIPIVLGGGHDITLPCVTGLLKWYSKIGGINIDVHFDVREQKGDFVSSGMAFRKLLEIGKNGSFKGKNFVEIGADGTVNSKKYFIYLKNNDVTVIPIKMIRDLITQKKDIETFMNTAFSTASKNTEAIFTSLDIDSVSSDAAPGCSFTNPNGFSTDEISRIAHSLGFNKQVKYFDIVEVNPKFDIDNRTSRLCARVISCFLTGYKQRIEHEE